MGVLTHGKVPNVWGRAYDERPRRQDRSRRLGRLVLSVQARPAASDRDRQAWPGAVADDIERLERISASLDAIRSDDESPSA